MSDFVRDAFGVSICKTCRTIPTCVRRIITVPADPSRRPSESASARSLNADALWLSKDHGAVAS